MNSAGELVLIVSVLFLGLALLGLLGRPDRSRLVATWVATAGFAGLAAFYAWEIVQLNRSRIPVYYDLPTTPGELQKITLYKPGTAPGYHCRLVHRKDHSFDKDLVAKLAAWSWKVVKCERLKLSHHTFNPEGVLEFESQLSSVVLQYDVRPQTRPILQDVVLEVTCPLEFRTVIVQASRTLTIFMTIYLGGVVLAAFGAVIQRRRMGSIKATAALLPTL